MLLEILFCILLILFSFLAIVFLKKRFSSSDFEKLDSEIASDFELEFMANANDPESLDELTEWYEAEAQEEAKRL